MNKTKLLLSSLVLLSPVAQKASTVKNNGKSPRNMVIFVADDLATCELGCYGGTNVKTPNIDRFASEGVQFTRLFSSTTMCSPVRATLYTGLYPVHNGVVRNHGNTKPTVKSIVQYLEAMGYRVGLTGKTDVRPKSVYSFEVVPGFETDCVKNSASYTTDGISSFMSRDNNQPFCLVVCSTNPHVPWTEGDYTQFDPNKVKLPPHFVDNKETREAFTHYLAEISALDKQFGDVLAALKNSGKAPETMVMFCGEQGPQFPGGKWTSWDFGQHSAFMIQTPEAYLHGKKSDAMLQYEDVLPTLIEYAGGKAPKELDGISILPVLRGEKNTHRKWAYGVHNNIPEGTAYPIRCIRNDQYKLIVNLTPEASYYEQHLMGIDKENYWKSWVHDSKTNATAKKWVDRYTTRPEIEFYDTQKDPWELNNLASEPALQDQIGKMKQQLFKWMKEQGDPGKALDQKKQ